MTEEGYVTVEKVAHHFGVKVHTIRSWVRMGYVPRNSYVKAGNTYRFSIPRMEVALTGGNIDSPEPETPDSIGDDTPALVGSSEDPVQLELNFDTDKDI